MYALCFLGFLCIGYYYFNQYYPQELKYNIYFGLFISISVLLLYLFHFEKDMVYKVFKNVNDIHNKPLYDISVFKNTSYKDTSFKNNISNEQFKSMILDSQGHRCYKCNNFILQNDIRELNLQYKQPIYTSGDNSHNNLMILCPTCQNYLT